MTDLRLMCVNDLLTYFQWIENRLSPQEAAALDELVRRAREADELRAELAHAGNEIDVVASAFGRWRPLANSVDVEAHELVNELRRLGNGARARRCRTFQARGKDMTEIKSGAYVIVRCRDAGVHAGVLQAYYERTATLTEARRLWYWRVPKGKGAFLSGVATSGLAEECKIGVPVTVHLTETCEIIQCSAEAEASIRGYPIHERK